MNEVWKAIHSCPNYEASSLGRIRRATPGKRTFVGRILRQKINNRGYSRIVVTHGNDQRTKIVHRLVCEAFHGPRPDGTVAAHNDGNRSNNIPDNLRWATWAENAQDTLKHGRGLTGEKAPHAKLTAYDVVAIRAAFEAGRTPQTLAKQFGVHYSNIHYIVKRQSWRHILV